MPIVTGLVIAGVVLVYFTSLVTLGWGLLIAAAAIALFRLLVAVVIGVVAWSTFKGI